MQLYKYAKKICQNMKFINSTLNNVSLKIIFLHKTCTKNCQKA